MASVAALEDTMTLHELPLSENKPARPAGASRAVDGAKAALVEHLTGLIHTPHRIRERALVLRTSELQLTRDKRESGAEMVRKLWWLDMVSGFSWTSILLQFAYLVVPSILLPLFAVFRSDLNIH